MSDLPQNTPTLPVTPYTVLQYHLLRDFAARYIWWKTADEARHYPERIMAQVMNLGTIEDLRRLFTSFTTQELRHVLKRAEPGWFNERSWAFWHLYLKLTPVNGTPPPMPLRTFGE